MRRGFALLQWNLRSRVQSDRRVRSWSVPCSLTGTCGPATGGVSGTPCAVTSPKCPTGFACSSGTCQKAARKTQPCPAGTTCSASGSCNPNSLFGDGDSGTSVNSDAEFNTDSACLADLRQGEQLPVDSFFMVDITVSYEMPSGTRGSELRSRSRSAVRPHESVDRREQGFEGFHGACSTHQHRTRSWNRVLSSRERGRLRRGELCDARRRHRSFARGGDGLNAAIDKVKPAGNTPTVASLTGALQYATSWATAHPDRRVGSRLTRPTDTRRAARQYDRRCGNSSPDGTGRHAEHSHLRARRRSQPDEPQSDRGRRRNDMAYLVDTGQDVAAQLAMALGSIRSRALTCDYNIPAPSMGALDYNSSTSKPGLEPPACRCSSSVSPTSPRAMARWADGTTTIPRPPRSSRSARAPACRF